MELSYWEYKSWLSNIDITIVGSGIVGLSAAIAVKEKYPKLKVLILEKGILPQGASTKNAGFACFGSISEILSDVVTHTEDEVATLVQQRWNGIQFLRKTVGDSNLKLQILGGHEVFLDEQGELFKTCKDKLDEVNQLLSPIFGGTPFVETPNTFQFKGVQNSYISHQFEGQIDTGSMMKSLLMKASALGIIILNGIEVINFVDGKTHVSIKTNRFEFSSNKLIVATNGFASKLLDLDVKPARAQVVVTEPIPNLKIKGTFHLNEGYYYFRNIDNRILFGGGRNLDYKTEETAAFGLTETIQNELERLLAEVILPGQEVKVDRRWSGIMGVGQQKKPLVQQLSNNVFCGVRLGGMGIAIGGLVGKELSCLV